MKNTRISPSIFQVYLCWIASEFFMAAEELTLARKSPRKKTDNLNKALKSKSKSNISFKRSLIIDLVSLKSPTLTSSFSFIYEFIFPLTYLFSVWIEKIKKVLKQSWVLSILLDLIVRESPAPLVSDTPFSFDKHSLRVRESHQISSIEIESLRNLPAGRLEFPNWASKSLDSKLSVNTFGDLKKQNGAKAKQKKNRPKKKMQELRKDGSKLCNNVETQISLPDVFLPIHDYFYLMHQRNSRSSTGSVASSSSHASLSKSSNEEEEELWAGNAVSLILNSNLFRERILNQLPSFFFHLWKIFLDTSYGSFVHFRDIIFSLMSKKFFSWFLRCIFNTFW